MSEKIECPVCKREMEVCYGLERVAHCPDCLEKGLTVEVSGETLDEIVAKLRSACPL